MTTRRRFTGEFKAKVALEALRGDKTIQEIAARHKVHPNQVSTWKQRAVEGMKEVFTKGAEASHSSILDSGHRAARCAIRTGSGNSLDRISLSIGAPAKAGQRLHIRSSQHSVSHLKNLPGSVGTQRGAPRRQSIPLRREKPGLSGTPSRKLATRGASPRPREPFSRAPTGSRAGGACPGGPNTGSSCGFQRGVSISPSHMPL